MAEEVTFGRSNVHGSDSQSSSSTFHRGWRRLTLTGLELGMLLEGIDCDRDRLSNKGAEERSLCIRGKSRDIFGSSAKADVLEVAVYG